MSGTVATGAGKAYMHESGKKLPYVKQMGTSSRTYLLGPQEAEPAFQPVGMCLPALIVQA